MESRDFVVLGAGLAFGFAAAMISRRSSAGLATKRIVATSKAPAAIGPYNQAVVSGDHVFVSGMIGFRPGTKEFAGVTAAEQARQCLENLKAVLEAADSSMDQVVKVTVLLKDLNEYAAVNSVYAEFFPSDAPARAAFQVVRLPADALVEIEAIAQAPTPARL